MWPSAAAPAGSAASTPASAVSSSGDIGHRAAHRAGSVLRDRDRNDAAAADESHRRLQSDQSIHRRGADDAAVGLGADADRGQARRDRRAGAGARAAGIAIEHVGVLRLPAARAPAGRRPRRAEVRPLAEVRLAEDDGAGLAQARDDEGVLPRLVRRQRQRAGRVHQAGDVDVVLQQDRDAVQRTAHLAGLALGVERVGVLQRRRVELDHRVQLRPSVVHDRDAIEIRLRQRA